MERTFTCFIGTNLVFSSLAAGVLALKSNAAEQEVAARSQEPRKVFKDSVTPLPPVGNLGPGGLRVQAAGKRYQDEKMDLLFSLAIPKEAQADLEARVARGEVVSAKELAEKYSGSRANQEKLVKWLKDRGFAITKTTPDHTSVYARATAGQIEKSLQVKMVRVTLNGVDYTAAQNAPSLPASIGAGVRAIIGLQPFRRLEKLPAG
jgi:kumamolisin